MGEDLVTTLSMENGGDGAAAMELSCCIVSSHSELVTRTPASAVKTS
jgi:hypothetical protein